MHIHTFTQQQQKSTLTHINMVLPNISDQNTMNKNNSKNFEKKHVQTVQFVRNSFTTEVTNFFSKRNE